MEAVVRGLARLVGVVWAAGWISSLSLAQTVGPIRHVFVIVLENHDWSDIKGNPAAPNINALLGSASYAENYTSPDGLHPSLPNYIWLEAGDRLTITDDVNPAQSPQTTEDHLTAQLRNAGISWTYYQEDISGNDCPLVPVKKYVPRHNPAVYFTDNTDDMNPQSAYCIAHVRPMQELFANLEANTVASYNFLTPNLCNDMHDCDVATGDRWLGDVVRRIQSSAAYQRDGAIFITFDESEHGDEPIGMMVLSRFAKGGGYSNKSAYTHSSMLRSLHEIFNLRPYLRDSGNVQDLSDLFVMPLNTHVVNAATYLPGALAPGELITIFGAGIGPADLQMSTYDASGRLSSKCGGIRVLIDGVAAPVLYAANNQITAVVPHTVRTGSVEIAMEWQGTIRPAMVADVTSVAPGIFQVGGSGHFAAALNQDTTVNSANNPAAKGSIVSLYVNGSGELSNADTPTGSLATGLISPRTEVRVQIGGADASVLYAGTAPGMISSVIQVNVRIPASVDASAPVPVVIKMGDASSPVAYLAVR